MFFSHQICGNALEQQHKINTESLSIQCKYLRIKSNPVMDFWVNWLDKIGIQNLGDTGIINKQL